MEFFVIDEVAGSSTVLTLDSLVAGPRMQNLMVMPAFLDTLNYASVILVVQNGAIPPATA